MDACLAYCAYTINYFYIYAIHRYPFFILYACTSATATTSSLGRSNQLISLAWITTLPAMFFWHPNLTQTYATSCSFQVAGVMCFWGGPLCHHGTFGQVLLGRDWNRVTEVFRPRAHFWLGKHLHGSGGNLCLHALCTTISEQELPVQSWPLGDFVPHRRISPCTLV